METAVVEARVLQAQAAMNRLVDEFQLYRPDNSEQL